MIYKQSDSADAVFLLNEDGPETFIPRGHPMWDEYELWLAAGNTPELAAGTSLQDVKLAKNTEINASRLAANFKTFPHAGKVFSCDALSRSDIDGTNGVITLTGSFPPNWPGGWKAVDNTYIPITTREQWEAFYLSMCATGAVNFAHSQTLKAALAAATTAEQVAAITW